MHDDKEGHCPREDLRFISLNQLKRMYEDVFIRRPQRTEDVMGPLVDESGCIMMEAIEQMTRRGRVIYGGKRLTPQGGFYVTPCLVESACSSAYPSERDLCPDLYVIKYRDLEEAVRIHNDVPRGTQ